jgi:E3 ubiquitin-protein ligase TRIP12
VQAVVNATLGEGVAAQLAAFRHGFTEVFPLSCLECFYEHELETLLCGAGEAWSAQSLADCIKFDHGYNSGSAPVQALLQVLAEMDSSDQRRFLRFVTGGQRVACCLPCHLLRFIS